jgi:RNA polymerase sigma-70 factor, ECF subfamily
MTTTERIDEAWKAHRPFLVDLAFRMLANLGDAEDVVQEAYTRLLRVDLDEIEDLRAWLIVVVSRLCLDQLRSARVRHHDDADPLADEGAVPLFGAVADSADRVTLDDTVRSALFVILERLTPAERTVLVLHDVFQFPFEAVSDIVGRTPAACRKLASRARQRIGAAATPARFAPEAPEQRLVVDRFIAACAGGDLTALMEALDPDVVGQVDLGARAGSGRINRGRERVGFILSRLFGPGSGRTLVSSPIGGEAAVLVFQRRTLVGLLILEIDDRRIRHIDAIADPAQLTSIAQHLGPSTA